MEEVLAGVPQGSILGHLFFLIFIADDTSLLSVVIYSLRSSNLLNTDLALIEYWVFQWEILFNPDPYKQAIEVLFSRRATHIPHPALTFNGIVICPKVHINI